MTPNAVRLTMRLAALALGAVIVQVAAVSQVELFGTNADLSPLVVASVGLLCGAVPGAVFGFCTGLFLDLALVQTVGLSSLVLLGVGYWAGRLRELRDPEGPLVPILVGAAATAGATVGYSLMQFLLGVDAPVSLLLARQILATTLLNAIIAAPLYALVRRMLVKLLPEDPRRRRRRAYTTGGLSPLFAMIEPVSDRRAATPISPQLALRVATLGFLALAVFGIIFFRLWYLQVLSGDDYQRQAADNRVRLERVQAPRGQIVDRQGRTLVDNKVATVVQLDPERLPAAAREQAATWGEAMAARARRPKGHRGEPVPVPAPATPELRERLRRLASVLDMSPGTIQERIVRSLWLVPYARITVRTDVPETMRDYLLERPARFPGIHVDRTFVRRYPEGSAAAPLVGSVGEISPDELGEQRFRGVPQGTIIGQGGLERTYDRYLRGIDGSTRITVDALGRPKSAARAQKPVSGRSVRLSLDLDLQQSGEDAMARAIAATPGVAGAFVALDPRNGDVLAMGSDPTFDPSVLARPITQARFDALFGEQAGSPLVNRAIAGQYPTGSTFKPVTALAGMAEGLRTPDTPIVDDACVKIGEQERCNARKQAYGTVALRRALQVSSDVYFYTLGRDLNPIPGQPLQRWARRLGFDHPTGIDLPGEFGGTIPDRAWRDRRNRLETRCRRERHVPACGIADGTNRPWTLGDNVNLAVGQGDIQATPLQMAVAYAAIANGGRVLRPRLGAAIEDANGRLLQELPASPSRRIRLDPAARSAIMDGLHLSTIDDGTSAAVFSGWNQRDFPVFGKTGTAQTPKGDQSWYVCYVPNRSRPIVIAATVEQGGFGADAAAPVARYMLGEWFGQKKTFDASASDRNAE